MNRAAIAVAVAVTAVVAALGIGWTIGNAYDGQGPSHHRHMTPMWDQDDDQGEARAGDRDGDGFAGMPGMMGGGAGMGAAMSHAFVTSEEQYLTEMVAHHEDAITAARELARSERPQMRRLGAAIVESQGAQVEQMQAWLDEWYPDAEAADYEPMMRDLSGLSGDALDRAFLADMVPHHMAAVMMSQQLLVRGLAEHPEVASLARDIRDAQRVEIVRMVRWSHTWFGTSGLPAHHGFPMTRMMRGWDAR
jgi:uncharacterized protein (DUF305 family)